MTDEGLHRLRRVLLQDAIWRYRTAYKNGNQAQMYAEKRWLLSNWGQALSGNQGEEIIRLCELCVNENWRVKQYQAPKTKHRKEKQYD